MELNGTWYARDCIKSVGLIKEEITPTGFNGTLYFEVKIALGNYIYSEIIKNHSQAQA